MLKLSWVFSTYFSLQTFLLCYLIIDKKNSRFVFSFEKYITIVDLCNNSYLTIINKLIKFIALIFCILNTY